MTSNKTSLNIPVIMGSVIMFTSLSTTPMGHNSNLLNDTTSALHSYAHNPSSFLLDVEEQRIYEEHSDTIVMNSYSMLDKTNEKIVYVDKIRGEMKKIENAFNGFVELSEQGKKEYKETLDALGESNGMNIFDFV
ncbi:MAG: hypothetical protein E6590_00760 [Clostridiales bacterium]|uniref:hypothetical protein n=1 Tax=Zhenhengia sp. TaxID=2944208 RepID=UPI00290DB58B|nr:hypothetical protein [Clostridiales bacterium]